MRIPRQALPINEKTQSWRQDCVEAYIGRAGMSFPRTTKYDEMLKAYRMYNGEIDPEDYSYVEKPYGKERSNMPSRIRNFNIIKPNIDVLIGEKPKRPFNFTVVVSNPDVVTRKEEAIRSKLAQEILADFAKMIADPQQPPRDYAKLAEEMERGYRDNRAIIAENAIRNIIFSQHWKLHNSKQWFDFLVGGKIVTHKGVNSNELFYETLNPLEVEHDRSPDIDFIEDGQWAVIRRMVTRSKLIDFFHNRLTTEQVNQLENPKNAIDVPITPQMTLPERDELCEWSTVYWKSLKRVGIRTYVDEFGDTLNEVIEEEEYNPDIHTDIQWEWINEVWQGHRLDGNIYLDVMPVPVQRGSLDNPSICKLPVNGRNYSSRNAENTSLAMMGLAYQLTYNVYKYRLETAIAKSKDVLAMLDINMIPEGWDMDKFMYYVDATGIVWTDYNKEGTNFSSTQKSILDLSVRTIDQYIVLLRHIVDEWERLSGINRQRQGNTGPYELKGTTEQSIIQSSHITEDYYAKMAEFERRELQGLVDFSQLAAIQGKKMSFVMPDFTQKYAEMDLEYAMTEFGVYLSDSSNDKAKLENIRGLAAQAVQGGAPMSMIAEIIDGESFTTIREKILKAEQMMQEREDKQREFEKEMQAAQQQSMQMQIENENAQAEAERQLKRELKMMEIESKLLSVEPQPEDKSFFEQQKLRLDERRLQIEERLKTMELAEKRRSNMANEKIDAKKAATVRKS